MVSSNRVSFSCFFFGFLASFVAHYIDSTLTAALDCFYCALFQEQLAHRRAAVRPHAHDGKSSLRAAGCRAMLIAVTFWLLLTLLCGGFREPYVFIAVAAVRCAEPQGAAALSWPVAAVRCADLAAG